MRFKEFLLREDGESDLLAGLAIIKKECNEFLVDVEGTTDWLYRGMEEEPTDKVFKLGHLIGRDPRDSSLGFNAFFNAGIERALKIPMVRYTAVFATGSISGTKEYGHTYFVFPTKNYKYIWSEIIADSYVQDDRLYSEFAKQLEQLSDARLATSGEVKNAFTALVKYSGGSIQRAVANLKTDDEMVEGTFQSNNVAGTAEEYDRALELTFKKYYVANERLEDAIRAGCEIMFYKSDGMYYVPRSLIQSHINSNKDLEGQSPEEFLDTYFWAPGA